MSPAAAVSAAIGRIARLATAIPAMKERSEPIATPPARNNQSRPIVSSTADSGRAYWT